MSQTLIINLRRFGDIFSCGHLINSIKKNSPHTAISMLVYKEFEEAANLLLNIDKVYTINRKDILTYNKNALFSNALALNEFYNEICPLKQIKWDTVINYSNEFVGAYLTSFIGPKDIKGISIGRNGIVKASNEWAELFNEVMPEYPQTPVHFIDCYHNMSNVTKESNGVKIKTRIFHDETTKKYFNRIRTKLSQNSEVENVRLVGVQLRSSRPDKDIPVPILADLIQRLIQDPNYYPLLMVAPVEADKKIANQLNSYFENHLLSIESDFTALPSVVSQLDILITPDTAIKHIADLTNTLCLEISLGSSPFRKQGTIRPGNLVLSVNQDKRQSSELPLNADDIYFSIQALTEPEFSRGLKLSPGMTLYRVEEARIGGIWYRPVSGEFDSTDEIYAQLSRAYIMQIFKNGHDAEPIQHIMDVCDTNVFKAIVDKEHLELTETLKGLLSTLRSLRAAKVDKKNSKVFIQSLDQLLASADNKGLISMASLLFRGRINAISSMTFEQNTEDMEKLIYRFKNDIQTLLSILTEVKNTLYHQKGKFIAKRAYEYEHHQC